MTIRHGLWLAALLLLLPSWVSAQGGGFVAIVEGDPITRYQLERELQRRLVGLSREYPAQTLEEQKNQIRAQVLDEMVTKRLLLQRCDAENIVVTKEDVDFFLDQQLERARKDGETIRDRNEYLRRLVEQSGETVDEVRTFFREEMRIARLFRKSVFKDSFVSPKELRSFYRENRADFATDPKHVFRMILVWRSNPDLESILTSVQKELADGTEFMKVLEKHSEGPRSDEGGLYEVSDEELDSYLPPLPALVRRLKVGAHSEPVLSPHAVHIVKLISRESSRELNFEEAQEKIRDRILLERRILQQQAFEKNLRENAYFRKFLDGAETSNR